MSESAELRINRLFLKKEQLLSAVKDNISFLKPFVRVNSGIRNTPKDSVSKFHSTSSAYTFYYLYSVFQAIDPVDLPKDLRKQIEATFTSYGERLISTFRSQHGRRELTSVGKLPNNYNTPIQIAGILAYLKLTNSSKKNIRSIRTIEGLLNKKNRNSSSRGYIQSIKERGFLERIGTEKNPVPSPYHTFWAIESILLFDQVNSTRHFDEIFIPASEWALDALAKSISFSHSGLTQALDPIEASYLMLILFSLFNFGITNLERRQSFYKVNKLIVHCLEAMFSKYFENGCFTKSLPVFASTKNFSLSCPTVEPISILVLKSPQHFFPYVDKLGEIFNWIIENEIKIKNANRYTSAWRSEWEHLSSPPTSFMTTSVMTFLIAYYSCIDKLLADSAFSALGVAPFLADAKKEEYQYPGTLGDVVRNYIINPIKSKERELAHFSMILFGPPGTSKTTISKRIAQDLGWPLLVINASVFLKGGVERIDAEAERIFRMASYLKDVVVLFDEVEELILRRDNEGEGISVDQRSRLLTTAMLPRINDLRSSSRVVFIFATNYLDHIDTAISRTGRFDCVHCVMPPSEKERRGILRKEIKKYKLDEGRRIERHLLNSPNVQRTNRFCYSDLRDLVKRVVIAVKASPKEKKGWPKARNRSEAKRLDTDIIKIIDHEIDVGHHATITEEMFEKFMSAKAKCDRPNPKK